MRIHLRQRCQDRRLQAVLVDDRLVGGGYCCAPLDRVVFVEVKGSGAEGGDRGGEIIAEGTPEEIAETEISYTGRFLKETLKSKKIKKPKNTVATHD